jgi:hypothetical protein
VSGTYDGLFIISDEEEVQNPRNTPLSEPFRLTSEFLLENVLTFLMNLGIQTNSMALSPQANYTD